MTIHVRPRAARGSPGTASLIGRIFFDAEGRPGIGWRCGGYLAVWFLVVGLLSGVIGGKNPSALQQAGYAVLVVPAVLGITYLFRRYADRRDWNTLGVSGLPSHLTTVAAGFGAGLASMAALTGIEWALGWLRFTGTDLPAQGAGHAVLLLGSGLVYYAATAVTEEIAFRGYLLRNTAAALPAWASAVIVGIVFGGLHLLTNQLATGWFVLIVPLSAVILQGFLAQTWMVTGALWLAIGWHAAWDWTEYQVIDLGSGASQGSGNYLIRVHQSGPLLFTGQPSLIEGGLMAGFVTAALLGLALLASRGRGHSWRTRIPDPQAVRPSRT